MKNVSTRIKILNKASSLLDLHGPLGVKPSLIALHLNLSPSLVSYHFPDPSLLCAYGAGRTLLIQIEKEQKCFFPFDSIKPKIERSSDNCMLNWLEVRLAWVEENKHAAAVLAFPSVYKSNAIEDWRAAEEKIINTLIPHVIIAQGKSIPESRLVAKGVHNLTFLGGEITNLKSILSQLLKVRTV